MHRCTPTTPIPARSWLATLRGKARASPTQRSLDVWASGDHLQMVLRRTLVPCGKSTLPLSMLSTLRGSRQPLWDVGYRPLRAWRTRAARPPPRTASGTLPASDFEGLLSGPAGHVTAPARPSSRVRATFQTVSSLRTLTWLGASPMPCSPRRVHDMAWPPLLEGSRSQRARQPASPHRRLETPFRATLDPVASRSCHASNRWSLYSFRPRRGGTRVSSDGSIGVQGRGESRAHLPSTGRL